MNDVLCAYVQFNAMEIENGKFTRKIQTKRKQRWRWIDWKFQRKAKRSHYNFTNDSVNDRITVGFIVSIVHHWNGRRIQYQNDLFLFQAKRSECCIVLNEICLPRRIFHLPKFYANFNWKINNNWIDTHVTFDLLFLSNYMLLFTSAMFCVFFHFHWMLRRLISILLLFLSGV